jgi:tetratricopeptide (TPR) repeat protein
MNKNAPLFLTLLLALGLMARAAETATAPPDAAAGDAKASHGAMPDMNMGAALPATLADWSKGAQLYEGLGTFHRRITTRAPLAQRYFDQGMRLMFAFNHDEATRSFARALQIDRSCAMCAWGVAYTIGPNYNLPMLAEARAKIAFEATGRAQRLARQATPVEKALIATLPVRYPNANPLDPQTAMPVLTAYSTAMRGVAQRFAQDLDVQTLYAESLMNLHAWKLWGLDGTPTPGTEEIVKTLEGVMARDPQHMGALHFYVHTMEASPHPEAAVPAAERLRGMAPGAGHLEHMPAHIMHRVGRFEDSAEANRKGVAADIRYLAATKPLDYYPMYFSHNYQFLAFSAAAEGRDAETIEAVKASRASISDDLLKTMPGVDWYVAELYFAYVRFGRWDALLAEAVPDRSLPGLHGGYLYATSVALAAKGRVSEAKERLAALDQFIPTVPADMPAGQVLLRNALAIARRVAAARIASAEGRSEDALRDLREAALLEDTLGYDEPAGWFFPVRHVLGAELLRAGRAADAESVYRESLLRQKGDGWALYGLAQALQTQGRSAEAQLVRREFDQAWRHATVEINSSAL